MPKDLKMLARIQKALVDIENGMSVRDAAAHYGCTMPTLYIHMQKNNVKRRPQLDTLSDAEEERLGNWFVYCYYMGYFQKAVTNLHKEATYLGRQSDLRRRFDQEWCRQFPLRIPYVKNSVDVYEDYSKLCDIKNKCQGTLLIYCRNRDMLHCFQDARYLYYILQLDIADHLKMMLAYSADGRMAHPLIINSNLTRRAQFDELPLPHNWIKYNWQEVPNIKNQDIPLMYYVEQVLKPHLILEDTTQPILLFHKYIFVPISLVFYELCTRNQVYPVNSQMQMSAFKLHQSLQMEISFRTKSATDQEMSSYVGLMKEVLEVKLTKERMSESFQEFGIYPLAVDERVMEKLPRLQMRSIVDRASTSKSSGGGGENKTLSENNDSPDTSTTAGQKRKSNDSNSSTCAYKVKRYVLPESESEDSSDSDVLEIFDSASNDTIFDHVSLDDSEDVQIVNVEPAQDPLCISEEET